MDRDWYPYSVNIELTLACNMRCLHCGSTAGKARRDELTREEFARVFRGLAALGCSEVCLLGGEPFMRKDWYAVAGDAADAGLKLVFITNGLAVRESVVGKLRRLGAVDRVGVSVDGPTARIHERIRGRKGSFEKAWRAARLLRDGGFETGIITTVSRINFSSLEAMKDLVAGQSFTWQIQTAAPQGKRFDREFIISPLEFYEVGRLVSRWRNTIPVEELPVCGSHDLGYFSNTLTRYAELPEWYGCGAGLYTLGIMSDGRVKGCLCQHDDFIEAHVRRRGVEEIWNDERLFARNRRFRVELLEGDCRGCEHGSVCRAGCSNLSYTMTGSTYNNPYCFHRMERLGIVKGRGRRRSSPRQEKSGPRGFRGRKVP
jgi:radical SAM protein with 4Fe4S-binding SPASM domain